MSVSKTSLAKSISSVPVLETGIKSGNNTNIIGATSTFDNSGDATRFPGLGGSFTKIVSPKISQKYTTPAGNTNNDAYEVAQRVINLEEKMLTKQEILEPGNGIDINGKTINLSEEISTLPERLDKINQEIDDLSEKIGTPDLSEKYYTIDQTQEYVQQAVSNISIPNTETIYDSGSKEYKHVTIINDFDEEDFMDKQKEN